MPQLPWPDTMNALTGQGGWVFRLEEWMDTRTLHREGHSIKEIARQPGRSRNTARRVLREAEKRALESVHPMCLVLFARVAAG